MESTMNTEKSTHRVEVIKIDKLMRHENADRLSKVKIYDYVSCVVTEQWKNGDLAAWIPPDSVVDVSRPEFAFLEKKAKDGKVRIRTEKLRGIVSYGLLVHAPEGAKEGDDVAAILGVEHWEPQINHSGFLVTGGEEAKPPSGNYPKYDVDSFQRWAREVFVEGEPVYITEKINGSNGKYLFKDGIMYCGSRTEWKKEYPSKPNITLGQLVQQFNGDEPKARSAYRKIENWKPVKNLWWVALENTPAVKDFCIDNPGHTLYGEVYGHVGKGWNYGIKGDRYQFMAFDILLPDGSWVNFPDFCAICGKYNIPHVPIIYKEIPFVLENIVELAEGFSFVNGFSTHIKEGIVVGPLKERWDERIGRVKLKVINTDY